MLVALFPSNYIVNEGSNVSVCIELILGVAGADGLTILVEDLPGIGTATCKTTTVHMYCTCVLSPRHVHAFALHACRVYTAHMFLYSVFAT